MPTAFEKKKGALIDFINLHSNAVLTYEGTLVKERVVSHEWLIEKLTQVMETTKKVPATKYIHGRYYIVIDSNRWVRVEWQSLGS